MAHGNDMDTRYETPTFAPGTAFAWTLRSGEIARREAQRRRNGLRPARYETPTFAPSSAFAWTLRSGEIARRERQQLRNRLPGPRQLDILLAA
jgi:hypothetical protein